MDQQDDAPCAWHGKPLDLFCMDCSMLVCVDCLNDEEHHEMHLVEEPLVAYQELVRDVEEQLAEAEELLTHSSSVYETNLDQLEDGEKSMTKAVIAMKDNVILGLDSLTAMRKTALRMRMKVAANKRDQLRKLRETARTLTSKEFLAKRAEIERQCDDMIEESTPEYGHWRPVDDVQCDLIPIFTFAEYRCLKFSTTDNVFNFKVNSAYDVTWSATVCKHLDALQINLEPTDIEILKFVHSLLVAIPHPTHPTIEIRKTFDMSAEFHTFRIAELPYLTEQGFFREGGDVLIKIGIRPLDVLVEKSLLNYKCKTLSVENSHLQNGFEVGCALFDSEEHTDFVLENKRLENELKFSKDISECNFCTSFYNVNLAALKSKAKQSFKPFICDESGRVWSLKIALLEPRLEPSLGKSYNGAFVALVKGAPTKCEFFVELKHDDSKKTIFRRKSFLFEERKLSGWPNFIELDDVADAGFYPNGELRFRYGVKLLQE